VPHTVVRPSGRRADDVRALRLRYRNITFSGNYTQATGEVVLASEFGFKRILAVLPADTLVRAAAGVTGVIPVFDVAADGRQVVIRMLEDAAGAAGTPVGAHKTDAEAFIASSQLGVIVVGE
jgi:hypothetical protein